jgi:hypothetical protein
MATIQVQQVDANNDPIERSGQSVFITDQDAVAQIIATRLKFLQGEWWEDLTLGFPLFQSLLGQSGSARQQQAVLLLIQQNILGAPFVLSISNIVATFNGGNRFFTFSCVVQTQFGTLTVTNAPATSASVST